MLHQTPANAMYSGAIENGQMHGQGRLQYANNDVFEVRWKAACEPASVRVALPFSDAATAVSGHLGLRQAPRPRFVHLP